MKATIEIFSKAKQTKAGQQSVAVKTLFKTTYEPKTDNLDAALNACRVFASNFIGGRKFAGLKAGKQVPSSLYYQITYDKIVLRSDVSEVKAQWKGLCAVPQSKLKAVSLKGENVVQYVVEQLNNAQIATSLSMAGLENAQIEADKVIIADELLTSALKVSAKEATLLNETILN